jgi:hypothetical protein
VRAIIRTTIDADRDQMWTELQRTQSLVAVSAPVLRFDPRDGRPLPATWQVGVPYRLSLRAFGLLPLGEHVIELVRIDAERGEIQSREHGRLARTWNHRITVRPAGAGSLTYTDDVEIRAGLLTPVIWAFAHAFYRHRQRAWKRLLAGDLR